MSCRSWAFTPLGGGDMASDCGENGRDLCRGMEVKIGGSFSYYIVMGAARSRCSV